MTRDQEEYYNEGLEIGRKERDDKLDLAHDFLHSYESIFGEPDEYSEFFALKNLLIKYGRIPPTKDTSSSNTPN